MAGLSWLRGPRPCTATSRKGYWCTRTDRHTVHEAAGGAGRVFASWQGDFPSEDELLDTFTNEEAFLRAVDNSPTNDLSAADHNDLVKGVD